MHVLLCGSLKKMHAQDCLHRIDKLDDFTRGWVTMPLIDRVLQLRTCPRCTSSFKGGGFDCKPARTFRVTLCTLKAGSCSATVNPLQCKSCDSVVGEEAFDYNCVPGDSTLWFEKYITMLLGEARDASGSKFSHQAAATTLRSLHNMRRSVQETRRIAGGFKNAQK